MLPDQYVIIIEDGVHGPNYTNVSFYLPNNSTNFAKSVRLTGVNVEVTIVAISKGGVSKPVTMILAMPPYIIHQGNSTRQRLVRISKTKVLNLFL